MNKALDVLYKLRDSIEGFCYHGAEQELAWCDEIKAELQEAMKPKTCEGCKHEDNICTHGRGLFCIRGAEHDYYEPKESV